MKLSVWLLMDGKRGHEKQIEDLALSISEKINTKITKIKKNSFLNIFINLFSLGNDRCKYFPQPDLIIAAGHQTHLDAIQKKARFGGKIIIIMKPSLPLFLFDLSIISSHDKTIWKRNVFTIEGTVNRISNNHKQKKNTGLFLIGGPSKNFSWITKNVVEKINKIIAENPKIQFTLATSRRTPSIFLNEIKKNKSNIKIYDSSKVSKKWLDKSIGKYEYSWVTQDSISMLYELISSGSKVCCIKLESKNNKFKKLYDNLYEKRKINITGKKIQRIIVENKKQSSADLCSDYILNKVLSYES